MDLWNKEGIPHKGWRCIDVEDLAEGLDELDAEERKDYYETCEMCNHEGIRYVHIMEHPEYNEHLRVGCSCAERMEDDYVTPQLREKNLHKKFGRLKTFKKKNWVQNSNGNFTLKFKGYFITIMPSKYKKGEYGIIFRKKQYWKYESLEKAKRAAFDIIDEYLQQRPTTGTYLPY